MPTLRIRSVLAYLLAPVAATFAGAPGSDAPPQPLTLRAAVDYALGHNPELVRVTQVVAENEGVVMEAASRTRPGVSAGASYGYTEPSLMEGIPGFDIVPLPDANDWEVNIMARKLLYSGGATGARIRSAQARTAAARVMVTAAVNEVVYRTEESFLGVLLAREQIRVHEEALRVLEREREEARVRRSAGTGSNFEVMRADVAVANARPALIRAQNSYQAQQDVLATVMGIDSGTGESTLDVQGRLASPAAEIPLASAIETARAHRPELAAGESGIAAAHAEIDAARAGTKPQVSAVAGYELMKRHYSSSFGDTLHGVTLGAQVDWPIFDGSATRARVRQASAREAQAEAGLETLKLRIDLEVRDAHRALTEAADLQASAEQVIAEASESLRQARTRLSAGTATQLDVLTAQAALTEARSNLSQAQHDYTLGLARLRHAMGADSSTGTGES